MSIQTGMTYWSKKIDVLKNVTLKAYFKAPKGQKNKHHKSIHLVKVSNKTELYGFETAGLLVANLDLKLTLNLIDK